MSGFFSPNSKLYKFMEWLTNAAALNILWLLCCLPIVTIGASTTAAFTVGLRMVNENEGYISKDFFKAFKENIKQGIPMSFITLICFWAVYLDFQIYNAVEENGLVFLIIGIIAAYVFSFSFLYVYPLLARYENTIFGTLKNSFRISMKYFLRSLLLLVLIVFELACIFWNGTTLFVGVIFGGAFVILTVSWFANEIFTELEKIPGTVAEKPADDISEDEHTEE